MPVVLQVEIGEAGELALEEQVDLAGRAVALLFDEQLGLVVHLLHVALPFLQRVLEFLARIRTPSASARAAAGSIRRDR